MFKNLPPLTRKTLLSCGLMSATLFGCQEPTEPVDTESLGIGGQQTSELLLPGKADNFYSNVAAEFELSGQLFVEVDEATDREAAIKARLTAVGLYLTAYLTDKFEGIDINDNGQIDEDEVFFRNVNYGGFKAMVRNGSLEEEKLTEVDGGYLVDFTIDVAGPLELSELLIRDGAMVVDDTVVFDLLMPEGATSEPEDVARREIRHFDPSTYTGELEAVTLHVEQLPEISDAYPHYRAFVEDGVYDITMFFGHDYNMPRADLQESEETFDHLVRQGYEAPVATYAELDADSGPFTKKVSFDGKEVVIEVRLFHGDMFLGERARHNQLAKDELVARDVFFYNGHAGPYFGLYLDANGEADVSYLEIAELDMPAKQQLFVAQGCQTYSQYADMLYANPNKSEDNLDAITTINYSYGLGTLELFDDLTRVDRNEAFWPTSFYEIVGRLNQHYWNAQKEVFYGVMGIDGNDQLHPMAHREAIGLACNSTADCGSESGNICVETGAGSTCAARTLAESSCPEGTSFGQVELYSGNGFLVCY